MSRSLASDGGQVNSRISNVNALSIAKKAAGKYPLLYLLVMF